MKRFFAGLSGEGNTFLLADQVEKRLRSFFESDQELTPATRQVMRRLFQGCQEIILESDYGYAVLRPKMGVRAYACLHPQSNQLEWVGPHQYLRVKDALVQGYDTASRPGLVLDFSPYYQGFPRTRDASEIGQGISFLNRQLSGQMYEDPESFRRALLSFLRDCELGGRPILLNEHMRDTDALLEGLEQARAILSDYMSDEPYETLAHELRVHGFEPGWGRNVGIVKETMSLLARLLESPDAARIEQFLSRLPLVRKVLMVSPHGWFAQDKVLGRPDTGGQVTFVLDQVRAMERELQHRFHDAGVDAKPAIVILTRLIPNADDTTCCLPREHVHGTDNCWIIRVPFRDPHSGEIVPDWISRFKIWPYLEEYARESKGAVGTELEGRPDLVVGHYSDGNLVAHLLADEFGVTHCALAHALEKTKYLLSDSYWAEMESDYHFSLQFSADLIAYNSADFIISSSYREIAGTETELGMFESYETFSMPGLYRVVSGVNPRLARHNIVPPGVSEEIFYPYTEHDRRVEGLSNELKERFFQREPGVDAVGTLKNPHLPAVLAMARIDKIKNLSGLIELYGKHAKLRSTSNLLIVSSRIDESQSTDQEEIEEIRRMHALISEYELDGHVRWLAATLSKLETGEAYRVVADRGGAFAQPALMENFGLTVIESMACGLPVVVTCFGGPREIVVSGVSGEVANPNDHATFGNALLRVIQDKSYWESLSKGGVQRVRDAYNWASHARNLVRLANVYSYWNFLDVRNRSALDQYIHTLYHTLYRPRAQAMFLGE